MDDTGTIVFTASTIFMAVAPLALMVLNEKPQHLPAHSKIEYVRDPRSGICFARTIEQASNGTSISKSVSLVEVACEKVPSGLFLP